MLLKKLYSEPEGLFEPVEFHDGVNFIWGELLPMSMTDCIRSLEKRLKKRIVDYQTYKKQKMITI
jgi:hypothetical protein